MSIDAEDYWYGPGLRSRRRTLSSWAVVVACAAVVVMGGCSDDEEEGGLRNEVSSGRVARVGAAVDHDALENDATYAEVLGREFNFVTPENVMKWGLIEPQPGEFDFAAGDALVSFAEAHGQEVKGHALVWHFQLPAWVFALDDAALEQALVDHISAVVSHYRGSVLAWDVVNEAIDDGSDPTYRATLFYEALGPEYIALAFETAHAADPDALLFYNEYGIEKAGAKFEAVYALVSQLVADGVPIDGVGMQMHYGLSGTPTASELRENMERLGDLGLIVNISEMDAPLMYFEGPPAEQQAAQVRVYHDLVAVCATVDACRWVTFWGFTDRYTWWEDFLGLSGQAPLLFDEDYRRKEVYFGVRDALAGR